MINAYLRVSTTKQHLENQRKEIQRFAEKKGMVIQRWRKETVSGTINRKKRQLGSLIGTLKKGDVLIVSEISRLSRTMLEIMAIFNACAENGVVFYSIKEGYCLDSSMNSKIIGFAFSLAAEIERNLISARTREALAMRKAAGMRLGRPRGFCPKQKMLQKKSDRIRTDRAAGKTVAALAREYGVSRNTVYAFLRSIDA